MSGGRRVGLLTAVAVLYLLHGDVWLWNDATRVLGLPVGLFYHVVYCLVAAGLMAMLVKSGWPVDPDEPDRREQP